MSWDVNAARVVTRPSIGSRAATGAGVAGATTVFDIASAVRILVDRVSLTGAPGNVALAIQRAIPIGATTGLVSRRIATARAADTAARTNLARLVTRVNSVVGAASARGFASSAASPWLGAVPFGTDADLTVAPFGVAFSLIALSTLVSLRLVYTSIRVVLVRLTLVVLAAIPVAVVAIWFRTIALRAYACLTVAPLLLTIAIGLVVLASALVTLILVPLAFALIALTLTLILLALVALASALISLIALTLTLSALALIPLIGALVALGALRLGLLVPALVTLALIPFRPLVFLLCVLRVFGLIALRGGGRPRDERAVAWIRRHRGRGSNARCQRNESGENRRTDRLIQVPATSQPNPSALQPGPKSGPIVRWPA